jgi:hypothetical protein
MSDNQTGLWFWEELRQDLMTRTAFGWYPERPEWLALVWLHFFSVADIEAV